MKENTDATLGTFSQRVLKKLQDLGWNSSIPNNVDMMVEQLKTSGFSINNTAMLAIKKFGGLQLHNIPNGGTKWFDFKVEELLGSISSDDIGYLSVLIGEEACPIGMGQGYILLVCPSGKTVILHEQWFCLLEFNSLAASFEFLLFRDDSNCKEYPDVHLYQPD